jgi:molybdate transport system ATP-binding protein
MTEPGIEIALSLARAGFDLRVELRLPGDGVSVVFGPSGSGKSSLLRALAGLEPAACGTLRVRGRTWQDAGVMLPAHRRNVGVVFQHAALLPHLSVHDTLRYGWRRARAPRSALDEWIGCLALGPLLARRPHTLSGGERQRVALARALVTCPDWLLLDEPLSSLDAPRRADILPLLEMIRVRAGTPLLYVTHAIEEVARLADHLVLLEAGRVVAHGPALAMLNRHDLPLSLRDDAGVVMDATVEGQGAHGLLTLRSAVGLLHAHGAAHTAGTRLRVRIQARDVSLALQQHADTSLLNLVPATIEALLPLSGGQVQVALRANGQPLLARLAHRSVERLALRQGQAVWAQIKAVAVLV